MQSIIPEKCRFVKSVLEKFAGDVDSEGYGRRIPESVPGMMEHGSVGVWPLVEQSQTAWRSAAEFLAPGRWLDGFLVRWIASRTIGRWTVGGPDEGLVLILD
jgi:hypothetical protein